MITDFYAMDGTWLDCCDASLFDVRRLAAILTAKFGPVKMAQRDGNRYVKGTTLSFSEWLFTV